MITTRAREGGSKDHRAKQKWPRETHSVTYVPGLSTLSDLSRIVAQPPPSFLCCPWPASHNPSSPTSVYLVPALHLLSSTPFWPYAVRSVIRSFTCAVRSFTWSTILKSADPIDAFYRAIGEAIGRLAPTTVLRSRSGDKKWFDASCRRAYKAKQTAYHAWCRARSADHCGRFVLARAEAQMVYGAAKESHRNTLEYTHQEYSDTLHQFT